MLQTIKCFFGFHKWNYRSDNIIGVGVVHTIGYRDCECCGASELDFIYGNE